MIENDKKKTELDRNDLLEINEQNNRDIHNHLDEISSLQEKLDQCIMEKKLLEEENTKVIIMQWHSQDIFLGVNILGGRPRGMSRGRSPRTPEKFRKFAKIP